MIEDVGDVEHEQLADWDAAYVLGALAPAERREFERHLRRCERCTQAVAELAGLPQLLALVPEGAVDVSGPEPADVPEPTGAPARAVDAPAGPVDVPVRHADVVDLAAAAATVRSRRRRRTGWVAVAAAGALVVGGGTGWAVNAAAHRDAVVVAAEVTARLAPVAGSGVSADVRWESTAWGTRFAWSCDYPAAGSVPYPGGTGSAGTSPVRYELVVVDDAGHATQVATWTAKGTGAHGLVASSGVAASSIRSVEIRTVGRPGALASATV